MAEAPPYVAVTFEVRGSAAERWTDALLGAGAQSVETTDADAGTDQETAVYGEPERHPWPRVRLTGLFAAGEAWREMLARAEVIAGERTPQYSTSLVESGDWVRKTQAQFTPIRVSDRLWIVPTWCTPPDPDAVVVTLDPGLAFGTGTHPTTFLCLRWLAGHLRRGDSMLDYGCGSGILAIAAAKLGASGVTGVDIDPQAVLTSRANATANAVEVTFGLADEIALETFDVVVANILADPLELLAPLLATRVRVGGHIVLSGILEAQSGAVLDAYGRWFNIGSWGSTDGWVALAGERTTR